MLILKIKTMELKYDSLFELGKLYFVIEFSDEDGIDKTPEEIAEYKAKGYIVEELY